MRVSTSPARKRARSKGFVSPAGRCFWSKADVLRHLEQAGSNRGECDAGDGGKGLDGTDNDEDPVPELADTADASPEKLSLMGGVGCKRKLELGGPDPAPTSDANAGKANRSVRIKSKVSPSEVQPSLQQPEPSSASSASAPTTLNTAAGKASPNRKPRRSLRRQPSAVELFGDCVSEDGVPVLSAEKGSAKEVEWHSTDAGRAASELQGTADKHPVGSTPVENENSVSCQGGHFQPLLSEALQPRGRDENAAEPLGQPGPPQESAPAASPLGLAVGPFSRKQFFVVTHTTKVRVVTEPSASGKTAGWLDPKHIFAATELFADAVDGGRRYLQLASGEGWIKVGMHTDPSRLVVQPLETYDPTAVVSPSKKRKVDAGALVPVQTAPSPEKSRAALTQRCKTLLAAKALVRFLMDRGGSAPVSCVAEFKEQRPLYQQAICDGLEGLRFFCEQHPDLLLLRELESGESTVSAMASLSMVRADDARPREAASQGAGSEDTSRTSAAVGQAEAGVSETSLVPFDPAAAKVATDQQQEPKVDGRILAGHTEGLRLPTWVSLAPPPRRTCALKASRESKEHVRRVKFNLNDAERIRRQIAKERLAVVEAEVMSIEQWAANRLQELKKRGETLREQMSQLDLSLWAVSSKH